MNSTITALKTKLYVAKYALLLALTCPYSTLASLWSMLKVNFATLAAIAR